MEIYCFIFLSYILIFYWVCKQGNKLYLMYKLITVGDMLFIRDNVKVNFRKIKDVGGYFKKPYDPIYG